MTPNCTIVKTMGWPAYAPEVPSRGCKDKTKTKTYTIIRTRSTQSSGWHCINRRKRLYSVSVRLEPKQIHIHFISSKVNKSNPQDVAATWFLRYLQIILACDRIWWVIGLVVSWVVVMPETCSCGVVPTGLVWLTKPFGALAWFDRLQQPASR